MPNGKVGTFQPAVALDTQSFEGFCTEYRDLGLRPQAMRRMYDRMKRNKMFLSEHYQVAIDKEVPHGFAGTVVWWLSIKRIDREPIMDWRDLQAIKSALCGAEAEAIQLFPAESRVVDTSNQYHLYVFMKQGGQRLPRVPVGFEKSLVLDETRTGKARQRPLDRPDDQDDPNAKGVE
jgi:hypothetical protein